MAVVTLDPNADRTANWTPKGAGLNNVEVDEGVDAHDSGNTENTTGGNNNSDILELDATPGDFDVAIDYKIRIVIKESGRIDDAPAIHTRITDVSSAIDGNEDDFALTGVTTYTVKEGTVRTNTDAKSAWDGYEVRYQFHTHASGMPDGTTAFVTAVEVVVNYDVAVAGQPTMHRTQGIPFAPGRRDRIGRLN